MITGPCPKRHFPQPGHFGGCQIAECPFRQTAERQTSGPDPLQSDHRVAHAVEHAPHLALSAFVDRDLEPGVGLFFSDLLQFCRSGLAIIEINSLLKAVYLAVLEHTLNLRQIGLGKFMFGVGDQVREIPVICQDQHTLGVVVKPADGIDANLDAFQQVLNGRPSLRVGHGSNIARRLVQHYVDLWLLRIDELAVDLDVLLAGVGLGPQLRHDLAADRDPSFEDELLRRPARGDPGRGDDFLDTFLHFFIIPVNKVNYNFNRAASPG